MSARSNYAPDPSKGVLLVDWPFFGELSRALALKVARSYQPEVVVGIATAGVVPGAAVAAILDLPFHSILVSRRYSADTIRETRKRLPGCRIEVLIPDFQGKEEPLRTVLAAKPDVLNHNTETVPRLYRMARSGGRYARTLELLDRSRTIAPEIPTKSGLMVGLGEETDELLATLADLRGVGCQILTIGQYLRPSSAHSPMVRYYTPAEFADLKREALAMGFVHVESGPLVRSSYHAHETADAYALAAAQG